MTTMLSWSQVYAEALAGEPCIIAGMGAEAARLPMARWLQPADESDAVVLSHCIGSTLDIGCGPGRMSQGLAALGRRTLGIDVVEEAVRHTSARGVAAAVADVFEPVPQEGAWSTALLADGNIGIGGDPERLLTRVHGLLNATGRAVVDLDPPGSGLKTFSLQLQCRGERSAPFAWAVVGPESVHTLAQRSGFRSIDLHEHDGRWFAVLRKG